MSNNNTGTLTAMGASYPYSKEELSSMMDGLTKEVNSVAIKSGIDPGKWVAATPDAWREMYPNVNSNLVVLHDDHGSFKSAAEESLRRLREEHGYKKTISVKVPITMKPKANQSVQPVQQEAAQAETKLEAESETTDTPDSNLGSSSEDAGIVNVPELETGKEPLSERDEAERIIRKLCQERGSIPPSVDLIKATKHGDRTLREWFYPWWKWPERFGFDWSSELQRTKAKAAEEKAAAEEAAKAAAAAAASNIDEKVEEIEPIEEELPVEDIEPKDIGDDEPDELSDEPVNSDDDPEEPSDEPIDSDDEPVDSGDESEEPEDDEESEESEEEQDFNEETHYTVPPGFSGEISFKFENKSDEELDIWLYFSKFLEVELDVGMSGKRVFLTTSDDG